MSAAFRSWSVNPAFWSTAWTPDFGCHRIDIVSEIYLEPRLLLLNESKGLD